MFIVVYVCGWARAINKSLVKSVYVGQNSDSEFVYFIDTEEGRYEIEFEELNNLVGEKIATILKRDLEQLKAL